MPINEKDTKSCPLCCEEILSAAKKCEHCGETLTENSDMPAISRGSDPVVASSPLGDIPTQKQLSASGFTAWAVIAALCSFGERIFALITGEDSFTLIFWLMLLSGVTALIYDCILSYRCWKIARLGHESEDPTPGQAIGFCFIPFFNLYWYFATLPKLGARLCKSMGREIGIAAAILLCVKQLSDIASFIFVPTVSEISIKADFSFSIFAILTLHAQFIEIAQTAVYVIFLRMVAKEAMRQARPSDPDILSSAAR